MDAVSTACGQQQAVRTAAPSQTGRLSWPDVSTGLLIGGYLVMGRCFAYIGIPPLFIGEIGLAALTLFQPFACTGLGIRSMMRVSRLSCTTWMLFVFVGYGVFQAVRGIANHHSIPITLQCFAFNYYACFFFVGLWVGQRQPQLLSRLIGILAWVVGVYGVLYLALLTRFVEDGQPWGAAVCILGVLALRLQVRRYWFPLLLNALTMLALQVRAEWLGFCVALPILAWLTGRLNQLFQASLLLGGLILLGFVTDFSFPAPSGRGGEISARQLVGRALSAVDAKLAAEYIPDAERYASTVSWRIEWWRAIWRDIHDDPVRTVVGGGYGYPIWDLHPEGLGENLRTPHNAYMFALAYTGWLGLGLFLAVQLCFLSLMWRAFCRTGNPFGICYGVMILVWIAFDNLIEAPFGAIPFYLLVGLSAAVVLVESPTETVRRS